MIKKLVTFVLGVALGAGAGYFIGSVWGYDIGWDAAEKKFTA